MGKWITDTQSIRVNHWVNYFVEVNCHIINQDKSISVVRMHQKERSIKSICQSREDQSNGAGSTFPFPTHSAQPWPVLLYSRHIFLRIYRLRKPKTKGIGLYLYKTRKYISPSMSVILTVRLCEILIGYTISFSLKPPPCELWSSYEHFFCFTLGLL